MEGFTIIDGVVAVVIILSALLAYSRGFVRETLSIGGWIAAAIVAYMFAGQAEPLIRELPVINDFIKDCQIGRVAGFFVVFAIGLIVMSLITPLFAAIIQRSALGGIDQGLGFLFGVVRGALLVGIALLVYDRVITDQKMAMVDDSRTARIFAKLQDDLNSYIPEDAPGWFMDKYEGLISSCSQPDQADQADQTEPLIAPQN